jgi:hypothetical protein
LARTANAARRFNLRDIGQEFIVPVEHGADRRINRFRLVCRLLVGRQPVGNLSVTG